MTKGKIIFSWAYMKRYQKPPLYNYRPLSQTDFQRLYSRLDGSVNNRVFDSTKNAGELTDKQKGFNKSDPRENGSTAAAADAAEV